MFTMRLAGQAGGDFLAILAFFWLCFSWYLVQLVTREKPQKNHMHSISAHRLDYLRATSTYRQPGEPIEPVYVPPPEWIKS